MVSDLVAVPVLLVTLGFVGLYTGWKRRGIHAQMASVDPTPIRELASPGTVELEGTATPVGDPFVAPLTDREAVVAAWTVEEWDERGDRGNWREVARGIESPGFELDDGTGTVDVAPVSKRDTAGKWTQTTGVSAADGVRLDDVLVEFDSFPVQEELGPDEDPPESVRRLHRDHGLYEDTGSVTNAVDIGKKHGRRRYFARVIEPGDETYVLGHVRARDDRHPERFRPAEAVVTAPDDGLLIFSNQDAASLEGEFASSAKARLAGGTVSVVVGVVIGLVLLGVL
ncbi:hypothetical protein [Haloplanus aerogenes]|uniref:RING-type E3 ubiquitin transferase n=1 Tax=Haloplanus aerogenes TaxID=660522 RepID=A0A3M0DYF2_9EURY|nr:hypothetical protein [Haloplanus aerogenes]AZH25374.1 hypothetical protein DU502_08265 [Haloplanus aerogenes]RMB25076.1 hypothetical protein ATH50_0159 [Haloplanus aerogenes]